MVGGLSIGPVGQLRTVKESYDVPAGDVYQVQNSTPYYTGIPEDVITNTWHFEWLGAGEPNTAAFNNVRDNLKSFYTNIYTTAATATWAPWVNILGNRMKMYNLSDAKPRVPVLDEQVSLTGTKATNSAIATEVACVLSYHTDYTSGINKASQRGRIYLGGFSDVVVDVGTGASFPKFTTNWKSTIANAAPILASSMLDDSWGWVVYSRKLSQAFAVAGGWIDGSLDTQRRRQQGSPARTSWTS
jgi:hypothetical protein